MRSYLETNMKQICAFVTVLGVGTLLVEAQNFTPGQLAVLQAGNGDINLHLKQAPIFVDQFDPARFNDAPTLTVAIPTNGPNTLFFNGHAATEGNLTRSADHHLLAFAGYAGVNLLETNGVPSQLPIPRGFCTIGVSSTSYKLVYHANDWYQGANPRGVVTDGNGGFWGCGNIFGTMYYNGQTAPAPVGLKTLLNTRAVKIINQSLYATINSADAQDSGDVAGIYSFVGASISDTLPRQAEATMKLVVPVDPKFKKTCGFDLNPAGTIAYTADTMAGIQKYEKGADGWKLDYNFTIPQVIPDAVNNATGCFGLTVDFKGANPVIYATTTEGWDIMNSNRVVRIVDTGAGSAVTTIAQAMSTNIVFRGVEFTPE